MPCPPQPPPLRWWEDLLLFFLARSPRIERIVITQRVPGAALPDDWDSPEDDPDEEEEVDDANHFPQACAEFLENIYRRSPGEDPGQT